MAVHPPGYDAQPNAHGNPAEDFAQSRLEAMAQTSMEQVNQERLRMGLAPLRIEPHLCRIAYAHSMDMARRNFYSHINPDRLGPAERIDAARYDALSTAENIARGYRDPHLVVNGWMDSPGHRANILNPAFQVIGAGYYVEPSMVDGHFWTHLFAVPDSSRARDKTDYAAELLELFNLERDSAGYPRFSAPPALQRSATRHTQQVAQQGADGFTRNTGALVQTIADDAGYMYRRIIAHFVCGRNAGDPEAAYDQLIAGELSHDLLTRFYQHAAIGYCYLPEDTHRHYWFVLLAAP